MNADAILARVRAGEEPPENWIVFPLLRHKIIMAILGWLGGMIMGGGLLLVTIPIVIPGNYEQGIVAAIVTTLILCVIAFIFIGSLVLLVSDIHRLAGIGKQLIVITEEDFVKQEGTKITHVPLVHVRYVTARGRPPVEDHLSVDTNESDTSPGQMPSVRANMFGMFTGHRATGATKMRRGRMRSPTSLAFIDARTEKEVTVVNDGAYGDPFLIAAALKEQAAAATAMQFQTPTGLSRVEACPRLSNDRDLSP